MAVAVVGMLWAWGRCVCGSDWEGYIEWGCDVDSLCVRILMATAGLIDESLLFDVSIVT